MPTAVEVRGLKAWFGKTEALHGIECPWNRTTQQPSSVHRAAASLLLFVA